MPASPLISVIIPCYNDGNYLPETIEQLKKQTFTDFEVIIVNDGSTDRNTLDILEKLSATGIIVLHKPNGMLASARNHGIKQARGQYIVTLDADDYYHPSFFAKGLEVLKTNHTIGIVTSYIQFFGEKKGVSKPRGGNAYNFLFKNECPACSLFRRSVWESVGGYDEKMIYGYEDWEFHIRVTQQSWNVYVIPEKLFFYRQTAKSMHATTTTANRTKIVDYIVEKHKDWYAAKLKELIIDQAVLYRHSRISYQVISEMLKNRFSGKYK